MNSYRVFYQTHAYDPESGESVSVLRPLTRNNGQPYVVAAVDGAAAIASVRRLGFAPIVEEVAP